MTRALAHRLMLFATVLTVALASVVFAARMAPEVVQEASLESYLAMGGTLDEICDGEGTHHHAHHCPVCHLLPEAPRIASDRPAQRIARAINARVLRDLATRPQRGDPHRSPRAPPVLV
ncbi:hypothetical protein AYJ57_05530 [Salipiger sp. CCB-MM3]|uniref:DUF2946 family protein n=1 Tax=Salipiger sp. CCB-MM3 TaxID=1792508 RepID=UPI00080AB5C7|nr:DUF2946 family protein [Salipiger sp. CCB-MM3]ANT59876.1 hypothetical protein AYJ57_05530 [Salipiger sp. CCB-MM3]